MSSEVMTDAEKKAREHYFGGCPECGDHDGAVNVESDHYVVCDTHKTKWYVGSNLFSCWRRQNEEIWQRNRVMLEEYKGVERLWTWTDPGPNGDRTVTTFPGFHLR